MQVQRWVTAVLAVICSFAVLTAAQRAFDGIRLPMKGVYIDTPEPTRDARAVFISEDGVQVYDFLTKRSTEITPTDEFFITHKPVEGKCGDWFERPEDVDAVYKNNTVTVIIVGDLLYLVWRRGVFGCVAQEVAIEGIVPGTITATFVVDDDILRLFLPTTVIDYTLTLSGPQRVRGSTTAIGELYPGVPDGIDGVFRNDGVIYFFKGQQVYAQYMESDAAYGPFQVLPRGARCNGAGLYTGLSGDLLDSSRDTMKKDCISVFLPSAGAPTVLNEELGLVMDISLFNVTFGEDESLEIYTVSGGVGDVWNDPTLKTNSVLYDEDNPPPSTLQVEVPFQSVVIMYSKLNSRSMAGEDRPCWSATWAFTRPNTLGLVGPQTQPLSIGQNMSQSARLGPTVLPEQLFSVNFVLNDLLLNRLEGPVYVPGMTKDDIDFDYLIFYEEVVYNVDLSASITVTHDGEVQLQESVTLGPTEREVEMEFLIGEGCIVDITVENNSMAPVNVVLDLNAGKECSGVIELTEESGNLPGSLSPVPFKPREKCFYHIHPHFADVMAIELDIWHESVRLNKDDTAVVMDGIVETLPTAVPTLGAVLGASTVIPPTTFLTQNCHEMTIALLAGDSDQGVLFPGSYRSVFFPDVMKCKISVVNTNTTDNIENDGMAITFAAGTELKLIFDARDKKGDIVLPHPRYRIVSSVLNITDSPDERDAMTNQFDLSDGALIDWQYDEESQTFQAPFRATATGTVVIETAIIFMRGTSHDFHLSVPNRFDATEVAGADAVGAFLDSPFTITTVPGPAAGETSTAVGPLIESTTLPASLNQSLTITTADQFGNLRNEPGERVRVFISGQKTLVRPFSEVNPDGSETFYADITLADVYTITVIINGEALQGGPSFIREIVAGPPDVAHFRVDGLPDGLVQAGSNLIIAVHPQDSFDNPTSIHEDLLVATYEDGDGERKIAQPVDCGDRSFSRQNSYTLCFSLTFKTEGRASVVFLYEDEVVQEGELSLNVGLPPQHTTPTWIYVVIVLATCAAAFLAFLVWKRQKNIKYRKRQRIAELERDKAKALSEAKTLFLANMSHELRTPISGVIGMTSLLEDAELNLQQREYLKNIKVSGHHLLMVVNDLLDFSKIESGQMELQKTRFSLRSCIEDALHITVPGMKNAHLDVYYVMDDTVPEFIEADEHRLRQVLCNFLSNALKFTDTGSVSVQVSLETNSIAMSDTAMSEPNEEAVQSHSENTSNRGLNRLLRGSGSSHRIGRMSRSFSRGQKHQPATNAMVESLDYLHDCSLPEEEQSRSTPNLSVHTTSVAKPVESHLKSSISAGLYEAQGPVTPSQSLCSSDGRGLASSSGVRIRFTILDTGVGIPAEKQGMLFRPFHQLDASTSRVYGGTGLGLAICRQMARLMGGDAWLEQSTVDVGSSFCFNVRVEACKLSPEEFPANFIGYLAEGEGPPDFKKISKDPFTPHRNTVLVVDSHNGSRTAMVRQFQNWGLRINGCATVEEATPLVARGGIDLVLLSSDGHSGSESTRTSSRRGSFTGSQTSDCTFNATQNAIVRLLDANPDMRFVIMGHNKNQTPFMDSPVPAATRMSEDNRKTDSASSLSEDINPILEHIVCDVNKPVRFMTVAKRIMEVRGFHMISNEPAPVLPLDVGLGAADHVPHSDEVVDIVSTGSQVPWRVLIVEDNEINQMLLIKFLEKVGIDETTAQISIANNGIEACEMVLNSQNQVPHVIFMDMHMPLMDGFGATRQIRETLNDSRPPYIVAVTANAMPEDMEKCLRVGMDDYMSKPFSLQVLRRILGKYNHAREAA
eukprot:Clim_evm29s155 gene=Clim_evmTU29s155